MEREKRKGTERMRWILENSRNREIDRLGRKEETLFERVKPM